jgi:RimJ/RimL family protein N-acetyltransferase
MLDLGFQTLQLHRIVGRCDPRNGPSARLMSRLGMRQEAHFLHNEFLKGEWVDEFVFAILDDEWRDRGGQRA